MPDQFLELTMQNEEDRKGVGEGASGSHDFSVIGGSVLFPELFIEEHQMSSEQSSPVGPDSVCPFVSPVEGPAACGPG